MKKNTIGIFIILSLFLMTSYKGDRCGVKNVSTHHGEVIVYKVYYTLAGAWVGAGLATFTNTVEQYKGKSVYHITGEGKTFPSYDWFFKVRDKYETYVDTQTMLPVQFNRFVSEGGYKFTNKITFDRGANKAISEQGEKKVPDCIQDVLSCIYYARNIDFDKHQVGDKIPVSIFLDNEVYDIYIRYLGKFNLKTKHGSYRTIKFKPLLIEGTIFKGGEKMNVWVTDDENKIPVHIQTPILVGNIRVDLIGYKNLRNKSAGIYKIYK